MSRLFVFNTQFEHDFVTRGDLEKGFRSFPIYSQLAYLPILLSDEQDSAVVPYSLPDTEEERLKALWSEFDLTPPRWLTCDQAKKNDQDLVCWGASQPLQEWAGEMSAPDWRVVRVVNSKEFSFQLCPRLPGSFLARSLEDFKCAMFPAAVKTCFGVSARGNRRIDSESELKDQSVINWMESEWKNKRPLIVEPWVEKDYEFSTHWEVGRNQTVHFLGATEVQNSVRGAFYTATPIESNEWIDQQLPVARQALESMIEEGYFGPVSFDALVYRDVKTKERVLHPILEINARWTMAKLALSLSFKKKKRVRLTFDKTVENGVLPEFIVDKGNKVVEFVKNLSISYI